MKCQILFSRKNEKNISKGRPLKFLPSMRLNVHLSLLTMTNLCQMGEVLFLYGLRWLMRPILALYRLLHIEQERSEEETSVGDALAFPVCMFLLHFADSFCFVFTSTPSYETSPLCLILCNLFPRLCWYVEVFKGGFEGILVLLLTQHSKC